MQTLLLCSIIMRYSNFVAFPIKLNGVAVNTVSAIWTQDKRYESSCTLKAINYDLHLCYEQKQSPEVLFHNPIIFQRSDYCAVQRVLQIHCKCVRCTNAHAALSRRRANRSKSVTVRPFFPHWKIRNGSHRSWWVAGSSLYPKKYINKDFYHVSQT